jgi:hypothetical protein
MIRCGVYHPLNEWYAPFVVLSRACLKDECSEVPIHLFIYSLGFAFSWLEYARVRLCPTPVSRRNCSMVSLAKWGPLSERIARGQPNLPKWLSWLSAADFAVASMQQNNSKLQQSNKHAIKISTVRAFHNYGMKSPRYGVCTYIRATLPRLIFVCV